MQLSCAKKGCTYKVLEIRLDDEVKHRLEILGMTEKSEISVLNKGNNAVIIKVRGTRFALGKNFAEGILLGGEECV